MAGLDREFAGSIPEVYDRYLVPLIFEPYAADLARRIAAERPETVLETAAGSGVVTRAAAPHLAPGGRYVATDLSPAMLAVARGRQPPLPPVEWEQADALDLPFPDQSFDLVLCQFGVMFFPDRVRGFAEARRVLRPGGRFLFNAWDRIEENEIPHEVTRAVADMFPTDPPRFLARTPHGYHDPDLIRAELRDAGFAAVDVDVRADTSRAASPRDPAIGFTQGSPLRSEIEARDPARLAEATDRAEAAVRTRFGDGPVEGKIQALVVTARA